VRNRRYRNRPHAWCIGYGLRFFRWEAGLRKALVVRSLKSGWPSTRVNHRASRPTSGLDQSGLPAQFGAVVVPRLAAASLGSSSPTARVEGTKRPEASQGTDKFDAGAIR